MTRYAYLLPASVIIGKLLTAQGEGNVVVFRSDVSLVRVDAQVVDRNNRTITGLTAEDFLLLDSGKPQQVRNFSSENMPVDVVLLLDVSGSMKSHLEKISAVSHEALRVLGGEDRIAVMVFDSATRVRLPFRKSRADVEHGLEQLLREENFDGGTEITRALFDAVAYVSLEGRKDARRAIVIVTDDQTGGERNEAGVTRSLENANTVLSALLAPDAMRARSPGVGRGGSWPGIPGTGPLGGIILGRRGPIGGGPVGSRRRTQPAGTAEIARQSGGDSLNADDGTALKTTLARIRQRYALHFYLPDGAQPGEARRIDVQLTAAARRRYPDADVRFRQALQGESGATDYMTASSEPEAVPDRPRLRRRPAVNQPDERKVNAAASSKPESSETAEPERGWRRVDELDCGWRRPGEPGRPCPADAQIKPRK